jgi:hypothetical protein
MAALRSLAAAVIGGRAQPPGTRRAHDPARGHGRHRSARGRGRSRRGTRLAAEPRYSGLSRAPSVVDATGSSTTSRRRRRPPVENVTGLRDSRPDLSRSTARRACRVHDCTPPSRLGRIRGLQKHDVDVIGTWDITDRSSRRTGTSRRSAACGRYRVGRGNHDSWSPSAMRDSKRGPRRQYPEGEGLTGHRGPTFTLRP